jgi:hypothetical protein
MNQTTQHTYTVAGGGFTDTAIAEAVADAGYEVV